jgi:hypothetical protein
MPKRFSQETRRMLRELQETAADLGKADVHAVRRIAFSGTTAERSAPFPGFSEKAVTEAASRPDARFPALRKKD